MRTAGQAFNQNKVGAQVSDYKCPSTGQKCSVTGTHKCLIKAHDVPGVSLQCTTVFADRRESIDRSTENTKAKNENWPKSINIWEWRKVFNQSINKLINQTKIAWLIARE